MAYYFDSINIKFEQRTAPNAGMYEISKEMVKSEDPRWMQIEMIDDGFGNMIPTVTVNEVLKASLQQADLDADLAKEAEKQAKEDEKNALKAIADKNKNRKIDSLNDIKFELQNIYEVLHYLINK